MTTIVWFRDDLRLGDHPALTDAAADPGGVVCVFLLDEVSPGARPLGGAAKWWLHHSLTSLAASLAERGVPLILRRGPAAEIIPALVAETGAERVVWNRRYGAEREIDAALKQELHGLGVTAESFPGDLLFEPWTVTTGQGTPYRVYSPFWRNLLARPSPPAPGPAPTQLRAAENQPAGDSLRSWALTPTTPDWSGGLVRRWMPEEPFAPGERGANARLEEFLHHRAPRYPAERDFPGIPATSELSPHLRWGEISPRTVWHTATGSGQEVSTFLSELGWREFAWHTTFHTPDIAHRTLNPKFERFPWHEPDPDDLTAWRHGTTGIPMVDAGMRELWHTGYMHNRVRMITASFLTKHLLVDWRIGEAWFWDTLVDADGASNPFNWQWVAGSGLDAAPYFRVFNPVVQERKFDPENHYVKRWAPDSHALTPVIDLAFGRQRALDAYGRL